MLVAYADTLPRGIHRWNETGNVKLTSEHSLFNNLFGNQSPAQSSGFDFNNTPV
jgi:hypothetical protein